MPLPPCAVPAKSAAAPTAFAGVKVLPGRCRRGRGQRAGSGAGVGGWRGPWGGAPIPRSFSSTLLPFSPGAAEPLGPTLVERTAPGRGTVNFALFSAAADSVTLVLADPGSREPAFEAPLARAGGGVWAAALGGLPLAGVGYAFRVSGPPSPTTRWAPEALLLDPRAPLVDGRAAFGVRDEREAFVPGVGSRFWGAFNFASPPYDWGADAPPAIPDGKLVIYEVGVRPFTAGGGWEAPAPPPPPPPRCGCGGTNGSRWPQTRRPSLWPAGRARACGARPPAARRPCSPPLTWSAPTCGEDEKVGIMGRSSGSWCGLGLETACTLTRQVPVDGRR